MKIEITNRQKIKRVNLKRLHQLLEKVARRLNIADKKVSFVLTDNRLITDLNRRYFKKKIPTDVIAFPLNDDFDPDYLGEVVVSVEEAVKVGNRYDYVGNGLDRSLHSVRWQEEVLLYCLHGILHLIGYDDRTEKKRKLMEKKQKEIIDKLW